MDADVLGQEAMNQARDRGGRAHVDIVVPVNPAYGVEACAHACRFGELVVAVAWGHGSVGPQQERRLHEALAPAAKKRQKK